jgi:hypothetical protein
MFQFLLDEVITPKLCRGRRLSARLGSRASYRRKPDKQYEDQP